MSETAKIGRDEIPAALRRLGVEGADEAFIARAHELAAGMQEQLARIPTRFDKATEPAHVFSVPRR